jgi:hypothetical protein
MKSKNEVVEFFCNLRLSRQKLKETSNKVFSTCTFTIRLEKEVTARVSAHRGIFTQTAATSGFLAKTH